MAVVVDYLKMIIFKTCYERQRPAAGSLVVLGARSPQTQNKKN